MQAYHVDKGCGFNNLLIVNLDEEIDVYLNSIYHEDSLVSDTEPSLLGRFRRVDHEGCLISPSRVESITLRVGDKIILNTSGDVGILDSDGAYFRFNKELNEKLICAKFPDNEFGIFHSYTGMTLHNFNLFLDSFRVDHANSKFEPHSTFYIDHDADVSGPSVDREYDY